MKRATVGYNFAATKSPRIRLTLNA